MKRTWTLMTLTALAGFLSAASLATAAASKLEGGTKFESVNTERNPGADVVIGQGRLKALLSGEKQFIGKAETTVSGEQAWVVGPDNAAFIEFAVPAEHVLFFARHAGPGEGVLKVVAFDEQGEVAKELAFEQQSRFRLIELEGPITAIELRNVAKGEVSGLLVVDDLAFSPADE